MRVVSNKQNVNIAHARHMQEVVSINQSINFFQILFANVAAFLYLYAS